MKTTHFLASFVHGPFPPSFEGNAVAYLWALFGLIIANLLALEWLWRTVWAFIEAPAPLKAPVTCTRIIILGMVLTVLVGGLPDLVLIMSWGDVTPATRMAIAWVDKVLDGLVFVPFSFAWLFARLGGPMIDWQLERQPLPLDLWPTWQQMKRPLKIGGAAFAIAFALAFLR